MISSTITITCGHTAPHTGRACTLDAGHEGHHESGMVVWDAGQAPASLAALLAAVLGEGHSVTFTHEPLDGYIAHIDVVENDDTVATHTAIANRPAGALEAAAAAAGLIPDPVLIVFSDEDLAERIGALEEKLDSCLMKLLSMLNDELKPGRGDERTEDDET
jgi:hypothetical protein